ncbi:ABC transporter substrate-binding protein [Agarivorans sp. 1_MG-2023]|uniref:ABC transporter substrate-binding protein n=1 Tax=Agarivorans sp. 1_MG-2023 TaxID=3062634 RepID=UPI0026E28AD2|nr:ABC transporter substrate-binding protein [Agarivorans sp. 1_MG-2023]MDO6764988.1 ABC transporter substrate-binding protein [Agarivorans sp. 1_MG-2023]
MTELSYASINKKKKLKRGILIATVIAVGAVIAFTATQKSSDQIVPSKANTLSISGPWEISSLDPSKQGYILTRMQVIETLLNVNSKGLITAGLATEWRSSEDGLTWQLSLRKGVTFHDGLPMDADSVVQSLEFAQSKHGTLNKAEVVSIKALNSEQISIELAKPYAAFASLLTNYSNAILSPASYKQDGAVETLFGSGPYQMSSFAPPHKLTVKKFDNYWGQKPSIEFATYLTGHRAESRILQAKSGEADIVFTLEPSMLGQLDGSNEVQLYSHLVPRTMFIKLNAAHPFLDDIQVRKALSMGLNRAAIATNVLGSEGSETSQLMPSSMSQWFVEGIETNGYNLAQARDILADLGWQQGDSGVLERDGNPFKLTMITYADRPELTTVATAIQAQWAKLGVELKVDITNSSMIPAGHKDGSLEMALIARNFGFSGDPLPIMSTDFAHGGGDWGTMNWNNAEVDSAITELVSSQDPERSLELSQQVAATIYNEYPVLPISSYSQHTSVNKRVKNFQFDPFERDYFINQMEIK